MGADDKDTITVSYAKGGHLYINNSIQHAAT